MYKTLLCLRYLRTRYIALASIISVMLGVATMIVVNSVMAGFSSEMRERIHGILADVVVETTSLDGAPDAEEKLRRAEQAAGESIDAMTVTVEVPGMLSFQYGPHGWINRPCRIVGIKPPQKAQVGPLTDYLESYHALKEGKKLLRPALRSPDEPPNWKLTEEALQRRRKWVEMQQWMDDQRHHGQAPVPESPGRERPRPPDGSEFPAARPPSDSSDAEPSLPPDDGGGSSAGPPPPAPDQFDVPDPEASDAAETGSEAPHEPRFTNPFMNREQSEPSADGESMDFAAAPLVGRVYVGLGLISFPYEDPETGEVVNRRMVRPGHDVKLTTVTTGRPPDPCPFNATVVDIFKSGMSEYDSNLVFCNLKYLQKVRGMISEDPDGRIEPGQLVSAQHQGREIAGRIVAVHRDRQTVEIETEAASRTSGTVTIPVAGVTPITRSITTIQIKLKDSANPDEVVRRLREVFPPGQYSVQTWEQKQGPLLAAVEVESAILNVLLFLIIAVAGFGILAIFFMIVVEKTRDIGILKALGAGSGGVMSVFLSYGLALGLVGSGVGVVLGLLFVRYINVIEAWISWLTGREVFPETIYYFPEIPTAVHPLMVVWVALGAIAIAVLASILPARRAARLHPVVALRYE